MESDRIRLAQLGIGRWGHHLLRNFLALSQVEVVAVAELHAAHYDTVRDQFQLSPNVDLTTDVEAVLARPDVDAVAIATPAATHYDLIKTALKYGKHVLAEKPLALSVAECEELCALAEQQQRQLVVDHTYLFHPVVQTGRAVLAHQPLGTLRYGYASRTNIGPVRTDVDALWDLAIHDLTIFNHWLGATPIAVAAHGQVWLQPASLPDDQLVPGLADVAWLRLFYPSGFQAHIHVSWANADKQRRLSVVGDRGTLIFDEMQSTAPLVLQHSFLTPHGNSFLTAGPDREEILTSDTEPLSQVCEHFVQCVITGQPSQLSSGTVGTELVRVLAALSQSLQQEGQKVPVNPN